MLVDDGRGDGSGSGLFPHYPATPSAIEGSAEALDGVYGNLDALSGDVQTTHQPALTGVSGLLAGPMAAAPEPVKNNTGDVMAAAIVAAGSVRVFGLAVQTYNGHIDRLNARWATALANEFGVAAVSYPEDATAADREQAHQDRSDAVAAARVALLEELQAEKARYDQQLDSDATSAAGGLDQGPSQEVIRALYAAGGLPSTVALAFPGYDLSGISMTVLPSDLADMTPEQLATYLLAHPNTDPNILLNLDAEVKRIMGEKLAEQARAIDDDSSTEEIEALNATLTQWSGYLGITAQFVKSLGGEGMLRLISVLGRHGLGTADGFAAARELAFTLKGAAATASVMLPANEARDLARQLVQSVRDNNMDGRSVALSFLLNDAYYGTEFLDTMGDELDATERGANELGLWNRMSMSGRGVTRFFDGDDIEAAYDPMASYMSALGRNGEASLQFFTEGDNRQQYWIQQRVWGHDDFEGLLAALDSATTDQGNLSDPTTARDAAALVSSAVDYLANRDNNDQVEFAGGDEEFKPGDISGEGARSLAHMIGSYMPAVDYYNLNTDAAGSQAGEVASFYRVDLGNLTDMPVFEREELREVLQVGLSNDEGFTAMREAVSNYQNIHLAQVLSHHGEPGFFAGPNGTDGMWQTATNADARLEGLFMDSIGEVEIAEGAERDEQIKAWIDMGSDLAGAVPLPGGPIVGALADVPMGLASDALTDSLADNEAQAVSDSNAAADRALIGRRSAIVENLYDADVVTDQSLATAARQTGVSDQQLDQWFNDGFPSDEEIRGNTQLQNLINTLADQNVDTNEYRQNYELAFRRYFE